MDDLALGPDEPKMRSDAVMFPENVALPVMLGLTMVGELDSTSLPVPVFGETSVGGMMTEGMVGKVVLVPDP